MGWESCFSESVKAGILLFDWLADRTKEVRLVFVLALIARLMVFLPVRWLSLAGIDPTNPVYRHWSLIFLWASLLYLIVFDGADRWRQRESLSYFRQLGDDEKIILQSFIQENRRTCQFQAWASGIGSLVDGKILVIDRHVDQNASDGGVLICRIKPFALRYLRKHRNLINPS